MSFGDAASLITTSSLKNPAAESISSKKKTANFPNSKGDYQDEST